MSEAEVLEMVRRTQLRTNESLHTQNQNGAGN